MTRATPIIRPARLADASAIAGFTTNTFAWGDYVGEEFPQWLQEPGTKVAVVVDDDDIPVAVAKVRMIGSREGWLSAARVHPDHRRRGLGSALNDWCVEWVASRGGVVCRLQIEDDNEPASQQVMQLGYRPVLEVVNGERPTRLPPDANGFPHTAVPERLQKSPRAEADLAYIAWSTSDLGRASRGMFATEPWAWRRLEEDDLRTGILWACPSGWVLTDSDEGHLDVRWLMCAPEDVDRLMPAVVELADRTGQSHISVAVARVGWVTDSLSRLGFTTLHDSSLYEKAVGLT